MCSLDRSSTRYVISSVSVLTSCYIFSHQQALIILFIVAVSSFCIFNQQLESLTIFNFKPFASFGLYKLFLT